MKLRKWIEAIMVGMILNAVIQEVLSLIDAHKRILFSIHEMLFAICLLLTAIFLRLVLNNRDA